MGDGLAFSGGIILLAVAAAVIFVAFRGHTESLIPLYAVGVFLTFTRRSSAWCGIGGASGAGTGAGGSV